MIDKCCMEIFCCNYLLRCLTVGCILFRQLIPISFVIPRKPPFYYIVVVMLFKTGCINILLAIKLRFFIVGIGRRSNNEFHGKQSNNKYGNDNKNPGHQKLTNNILLRLT